MQSALDMGGNPSSVHAEGRRARGIVEAARKAVAEVVGAEPADVIFTSGGTEANALALSAGLLGDVLVSAIEHPSVLSNKPDIRMIAVTAEGRVDLDDLRLHCAEIKPALISLMLANNETGALQPVAQVAEVAHESGALLHVDAVQALGKIPFDLKGLGADMVTVSGHKIGGPQGVGALVLGKRAQGLKAMIRGGGQEFGRRAGTENMPGIAGFGAAITAAMANRDADMARIVALKAKLEDGLKQTANMTIFSADVPRLPTTTLFTAPGLNAETALIRFDLAGIAVSSGSACSSGKVAPSHVLTAMGYSPEVARGAIRVSLGWTTTERDIDCFLKAWRSLQGALRKADETVLERF